VKKLNGKCLQDFGMYFLHIHKIASWEDFNKLPESCQNALIIEFFDSVGIWNKVFLEVYENGIGNFKEATNEAIIKANQIFNEL